MTVRQASARPPAMPPLGDDHTRCDRNGAGASGDAVESSSATKPDVPRHLAPSGNLRPPNDEEDQGDDGQDDEDGDQDSHRRLTPPRTRVERPRIRALFLDAAIPAMDPHRGRSGGVASLRCRLSDDGLLGRARCVGPAALGLRDPTVPMLHNIDSSQRWFRHRLPLSLPARGVTLPIRLRLRNTLGHAASPNMTRPRPSPGPVACGRAPARSLRCVVSSPGMTRVTLTSTTKTPRRTRDIRRALVLQGLTLSCAGSQFVPRARHRGSTS